MNNPFPGMNPYLEEPGVWLDFHGEYIYVLREAILDRLPEGYDARVNHRMTLSQGGEATEDTDSLWPDVAVTSHRERGWGGNGGSTAVMDVEGGVAVLDLEPVTVRIEEAEAWPQRYIHIVTRDEERLVTSIELLSPSNKRGTGFGEFQQKRRSLLADGVNLVEIDLLMRGRRVEQPRLLPPGDCYVLVTRGEQPTLREVYAWGLRRPLPSIRVPLSPPDEDVVLDLAAGFREAFERGRYGRRLRYDKPPTSRLPDEQLEWVRDRVQQPADD